jgi:Xaa-Pro aminopeptidase
MTPDPHQANHDHFDPVLQRAAQTRAWETLRLAAARIEPGMDDVDGKAIVDQTIRDSGAERLWHASQVRFGKNTLLPFGVSPAAPHVLQADDMFFLDIGPCYDGHEGDVGMGFTLGSAPACAELIDESKAVFEAVKAHWASTGATGQALYEFAHEQAVLRGRALALQGAAGHRIGTFPHHVFHKGKLQHYGRTPAADHWILEIHLIDEALGRGAFYEDML